MEGSFKVGEWVVEPEINLISQGNKVITLEPKIMKVLVCLAGRPGEVVSKPDLLTEVWTDTFVTDYVLTRSISELRRIFEDDSKDPRYIQTIAKRGYRLIAPVFSNGTNLSEVSSNEPTSSGTPPKLSQVNEPNRRKKFIFSIVLCVIATGGSLGFYYAKLSSRPALPAMKVVPFTSLPGEEWGMAFSPDGNMLAFAWNGEKKNNADIYVKSITGERPVRLTTDPAWDSNPTWSPDGQKIAFIRSDGTEYQVLTVPALGNGPERKLFSLGLNVNFDWTPQINWSPDGKYIAYTDKGSREAKAGISLFSPDTGERRPLTLPPDGDYLDNFFAFSPDGRSLAFVRMNNPVTADLYVVAVAGGEPKRLTFDNAEPSTVSWSANGREIIFCSNRSQTPGLWRMPASGGTPEHLQMGGDIAGAFAVSRTGNRLAYVERCETDTNIYGVDLSLPDRRASVSNLVSSTRHDNSPRISPDGRRIAFESNRSGINEVWICDIDGGNVTQLTTIGAAGSPDWSRDGKQIAFDCHKDGKGDLYVIDVEGGFPRRLTTEASEDDCPSWSTDGKWIYFASDRSGILQVWKMPSNGGDAIQITKNGGGFISSESPDGKFLYYNKESGIWRAAVDGTDETLILKGDYGGEWAVVSDGIYCIDLRRPAPTAIEFFRFSSHTTEQVATLGTARAFFKGLAVSPDRRWILYSQLEQSPANTDIKLVENFR